VGASAVPLWRFPGDTAVGNEPLLNSQGNVTDPIPITVIPSAAMFVGPSTVTSGNGVLVAAGQAINLSILGIDKLFAIQSGAAATAYVLVGRQ
jgi:hypothetical protein